MLTAMAVNSCWTRTFPFLGGGSAACRVAGELVDRAFRSGANCVPGLPLGRLLFGADAELQVTELGRANSRCVRALSAVPGARVPAGQGRR